MKGFITNIEEQTEENDAYRQVLYTTERSQLVVMSIKPGEEIGEETHDDKDQFIRIEEGKGLTKLGNEEYALDEGSAVIIPAGLKHNVINSGEEDLKLYTIYTPPEHQDGILIETKSEADATKESFDGHTTED